MIDAHLTMQPSHPRDVYVRFSLAGEPMDPDSVNYDFRHFGVFGPYSILRCDDGIIMLATASIAFDTQADGFTANSVSSLRWVDSQRSIKWFAGVREKPEIIAAMKTLTSERLLGTGSTHSDLLAKALMGGATLTAFQDQSPTARLFGGPATVGHVLSLPDTHRKHVLGNTDPATDLPVLTDDARMDIHRFLGKQP